MEQLVELVNEDLINKHFINNKMFYGVSFNTVTNDIVIHHDMFIFDLHNKMVNSPDNMLYYFKLYLTLTFYHETRTGAWIRIKYSDNQLNQGTIVYL